MDPQELFPWLFGGGMIMTVVTTLVTCLISLLCTVVPVVGIFWLLKKSADKDRAKHQASLAWHMTSGKIIKSRVEVTGGESASVSPRIAYEYDVYGRTYQSEQIRAGGIYITGPHRSAYDIVDTYPVGATVTVYYDPNNPEDAALER
jgi:hypothetical protein